MKTTTENTKSSENQSVYDVIIAGAGPVGLFLACELALANCSVLILEKAENAVSPLKKLPFGIRGLSAPTIESLDRRGLLSELEIHKRIKNPHQNSGQGSRRQVGHFAGIPFHEGDIDSMEWKYRPPGSTATSLISEIAELENIFTRRAKSFGVEIKRGFAVTSLHSSDDGVTVYSEEKSFRGQWLVGCDGARSAVRKTGGFEFTGTEPEFTGYTMQVDIADSSMLLPGRNMTLRGMYLQSQPGYLMMQDFDSGAFHHSEKPLTREHLQEVLRRISNSDVTINKLQVATTWTDRAKQATEYRRGRILLAGDAAHIHSPLGGQGLNLGLGDAMNLGWKLAVTINKKAPEEILDSYHKERHPVGVQVLEWSRAQVAIMRPDPYARALNAIFRDLLNTRDGATYFAGRVWGIFMKYDLGGNHPLTGRSVPNFEFEDGAFLSRFMEEGHGILLDFDSKASLKILAGTYGDQIKYISGNVKERLGINAVLIRPDGIVAWASDNDPDIHSFRNAAARWVI